MTTVYACSCGWKGKGIGGAPFTSGRAPARCQRCASTTFTLERHVRARITLTCTDCRQDFIGLEESRYCEKCRGHHRGYAGRTNPTKRYVWSTEALEYLRAHYNSKRRGRCAAIGLKLGFPQHQVKLKAQELGLCHPRSADRRDWTAEEERYLQEWTGVRSSKQIAKHMGRSLTSVVQKQHRLQLQTRVQSDGFTLRDLQLAFGCEHRVIQGWVNRGWLQVGKRGTDRARDVWEVSNQSVIAFIVEHPTAYRLDRVDQAWFLSFITDPETGIAAFQRRHMRTSAA